MENYSIIKNMIKQFAFERSGKTAFSLFDGEVVKAISYQDFAQNILQVAGYFVSRNITRRHIAIMAPNSYDWLVTYFAVIGSGNIAVLMNQDLPSDVLQWQCDKADVSMVCTDQEVFELAKENLIGVECVCFEELKSDAAITVDMLYDTQEEDTIQMLFTSGTTGKSKAVEHSANNWKNMMPTHGVRLKSEKVERVCIPVPFYHSLGLESVSVSLFNAKTICIGRGIKYLFMDMAFLNPDLVVMVPSMVESLAKILKRIIDPAERTKYIGSNLHHIGYAGAVLKEPVLRALLEQGFTMSVNFGMSEIPGASTICIVKNKEHYRSAGKFTPNTEYRFEEGELLLKSARVMKGYYKDPVETVSVIRDGWLHTGDLGYVDENGYFFLTGRKKNVIILSNGENVNPEEIETSFGACMDILECMVYGDGKGICADVYTNSPEAVKSFVKEYNKGIPLYRQVYKVNCTATPLEKTGSGKIKRKVNIYE